MVGTDILIMDAKPRLRSCGEQNLCCYMTAPFLVWNLQMWKIHALDHKKLLLPGSIHKKQLEKNHTFAILFNTASQEILQRNFSCHARMSWMLGPTAQAEMETLLLKELATLPPRKLP